MRSCTVSPSQASACSSCCYTFSRNKTPRTARLIDRSTVLGKTCILLRKNSKSHTTGQRTAGTTYIKFRLAFLPTSWRQTISDLCACNVSTSFHGHPKVTRSQLKIMSPEDKTDRPTTEYNCKSPQGRATRLELQYIYTQPKLKPTCSNACHHGHPLPTTRTSRGRPHPKIIKRANRVVVLNNQMKIT